MRTSTARGTVLGLKADLDAYRTCELATLSRQGTPIAWPTAPLITADGTIVLTTSIALPQKAYNIRRDPRVALLFSDPTGSGRTDLPQVLVQGTATCPDVIHTSASGLEEYWARLAARQPSSAGNSSTAAARWLFDWYYMRLVITVTPDMVTSQSPVQEAGQLTAPKPERGDRSPYAEVARRLPTYRSAVIGTLRDSESPSLQRARLVADPAGRRFFITDHNGPLSAGPASVLLHRHDEHLWDLHHAAALGELVPADDRWTFVPVRFVPGTDGLNPVTVLRTVRRLRKAAAGYLERRHLERPTIAWETYE